MTTYQVQRDQECVKEAMDLEPDVTPEEVLRRVKAEGIWNGEKLSYSKEITPYGFDLCLGVQAGTTRIRFVDTSKPHDVWPEGAL